MTTKALVFAVAAACLTSGAALAQSYDYRNGGYERGTQYQFQYGVQDSRYDRNGDGRVDERYDRNRDGRVDRDYRNDRQRYYGYTSHSGYNSHDGYSRHDGYNNHDGYSRHREYAPVQVYGYSSNGYNRGYHNGYNNGYGSTSHYQVRRGEYLASQYRDRRYVVNDWRSRDLYQPHYGHQWVQSGNDYAMVAIATGLIAAVLLNR